MRLYYKDELEIIVKYFKSVLNQSQDSFQEWIDYRKENNNIIELVKTSRFSTSYSVCKSIKWLCLYEKIRISAT